MSRPATKLRALPRERVTKALAHLGPPYRNVLELQAETGWHTSEVVRFCETGEIEEPTNEQRNAGVAGILIVKHKGGQDHRTGVSEQVLQAGRRLRRLRGFSEDGYFKAIRKACRAAGVHSFGPGQLGTASRPGW